MTLADLSQIKPLKCKKKVSCKVGYSDLERYIKDITGKSLEIPCILECSNDTDHDFDIGDHPEWITEDDKKEMEDFLFGDAKDVRTFRLGKLLEVMCMHGMLEKGNYTISVSW